MVDVARDEKLYFKYRKITYTHIRDSWYITFLRLRNTESICRNSIKRYFRVVQSCILASPIWETFEIPPTLSLCGS